MKEYLRILDSARKEEIFVYEALKEILFKNTITYIGDDISCGLADIFTDDFEIGVEVVTCERRVVHKYTERNKLPINFSMQIKSDKVVYKTKQEKYQSIIAEQDEFYQNLKISIIKKLKLLKQGNYKGTRQIFLCICSVFEDKPYVDTKKVAKIYKEASNIQNIKFDVVFLIVNDTLYMINSEFEIAPIDDYENSKINVVKID